MAPLLDQRRDAILCTKGVNLRATFQKTVSDLIRENDDLVLLLGDIGVFGFREVMEDNPARVINIGILEQAMTSFAAGLALSGKIPVLHSITPFLIERPYEQIKVDFGYQKLAGKFVSVGASFDYASLGASHHSPGDVSALLAIPGFEIFLPGNSAELEYMLKRNINTKTLSYFRLSEGTFEDSRIRPSSPSPQYVSGESRTALIAFGPSMKEGLEVADQLGLSLIYVNELTTSCIERLADLLVASDFKTVVLLQPFYQGTVSHLIQRGLGGRRVIDIGVPREFIHEYGTLESLKRVLGLDTASVIARILESDESL